MSGQGAYPLYMYRSAQRGNAAVSVKQVSDSEPSSEGMSEQFEKPKYGRSMLSNSLLSAVNPTTC